MRQSGLGSAARRLAPASAGLDWPRRDRARLPLSVGEVARLRHYERLMGLAHLTAVPVALAATLVHLDFITRPQTAFFAILLFATLLYAAAYHFVLPRVWLSHTKVVLGLCIDTALTTEVVRLTGSHMSLLVFLYYLIVIASALTLETRALYGICAVVCGFFCAILPFDPLFVHAASAHVGHVVLFVLSVWLVGLVSAAGAAQIQGAERRLLASLRDQHETAAQNARLSLDLSRQLEASQALAGSLERQRRETRRLADMVIRAQEDERGRVARELHDEANQTLAALMTTIDAAESVDPAQLPATLQRLRRLASMTLRDLQRIATELRPPALDEFGLVPALRRHLQDRIAGTGLDADLDSEGRRRRLEPAVEVALYRIAQEALANVQKHSGATTVHLRLRFLAHSVRLDVSDDGVGFEDAQGSVGDEDDPRERLGIAGMRERASIVGGTLSVTTRPGGGTRVSANIPCEPAAALAPAS